MRSSIDILVIELPLYSYAKPIPPLTPSLRMMERMTSLAYTPFHNCPLISILLTFGFEIARHWVANTSLTCDVPMPKAMLPNAPWVDVWESPQAIVIPGWVSPNSGP